MGGKTGIVVGIVTAIVVGSTLSGSDASAASDERIAALRPLDADGLGDAGAAKKSPCGRVARARQDRPDRASEKRALVHVVYLVAADQPDAGLDRNGTIECSMRAQQGWIRQQTGLEWRLDTFRHRGRRYVDVSFLRAAATAEELSGAGPVREELIAAGFDKEYKRYLSFVVGGRGWCGDAYWPFLTGENEFVDGKYAQVYLIAPEGCHTDKWGRPGEPSYVETVAQQELMHNDGMVPIGAPRGCGPLGVPAHVCTGPLAFVSSVDPERFDVMFPFAGLPLSEKKVDIGHDDYFRHDYPIRGLEDSPYLQKARS